jgi:hypothetical protein
MLQLKCIVYMLFDKITEQNLSCVSCSWNYEYIWLVSSKDLHYHASILRGVDFFENPEQKQ